LDRVIPVDIYIPGCPPRPNDIIEGIAKAVATLPAKGIHARKGAKKGGPAAK
jgi:Ni,Fe-hydrogenase III small subunit